MPHHRRGGAQELRNFVFAYVAQGAIRSISVDAFRRLLELDLSWHLSKSTGVDTWVFLMVGSKVSWSVGWSVGWLKFKLNFS